MNRVFPGALANFLSTGDLARLVLEEPHFGKCNLWICSGLKTLCQRSGESLQRKSGPRKDRILGLILQEMGVRECIILENLFYCTFYPLFHPKIT